MQAPDVAGGLFHFKRRWAARKQTPANMFPGSCRAKNKMQRMHRWSVPSALRRRWRGKTFEGADHPFVDRCAFLLDSSFMENARLAASRALTGIEELAAQIVAAQGQSPPNSRPH